MYIFRTADFTMYFPIPKYKNKPKSADLGPLTFLPTIKTFRGHLASEVCIITAPHNIKPK